MYPKPPDMRAAETQNKTDGELFYTIYNGIRLGGMPAFGERTKAMLTSNPSVNSQQSILTTIRRS
jgi:hypothetical protein